MMKATTIHTLAELESAIERGKAAYIEVGNALSEIRERKLYREQGHSTFELYCRERWGFSRSVGYDYINAAAVAENVGTSLQTTPPNFSQAVALAPLDTGQQRRIASETDFAHTTVRELSRTIAVKLPSRTDEWYTPKRYVEAARAVLGSIDLDPASCELANEVVRARMFYAKQDDGLSKPWHGKVWLNPPYGDIGPKFVAKLLAEHKAGHVNEAVLLVNSQSTDAKWFQQLFDFPICFSNHRLRFQTVEGSGNSPMNGSAFVYLGKKVGLFREHFSPFGAVVAQLSMSLPVSLAA